MWREIVRALCVWLSVVCVSCVGMGGAWASDRINEVLGDESWVAAHGAEPGDEVGEVARIRTHLRFVIAKLERADVSGLSQAQRRNRARALAGLSEYVEAGVFPRREPVDGFSGRRPQFIDSRGVHCAVGEMLRRTGHGELAVRIDGEHEFSYVPDIDTQGLAEWAHEYGFSVHELAMIQPGYPGGDPTGEYERQDILATPKVIIDSGMNDAVDVCGVPDRVPARLTFVLDLSDHSAGATLRATSGSAFAECAAAHHEEAIREHVAEHRYAFQSGPLGIDVEFGRDDLEWYVESKLYAMDMGWRTTGCIPHQGGTTLVRAFSVAIRSTEDGHPIEVMSTPRQGSFEACVEAYVRRVYAGPLKLGLGSDFVVRRRFVLNDGSRDARSQALLARVLPADWVPEQQGVAAAWLERLMAGLAGLIALVVGAVGFVAWRRVFVSARVDTDAEDGSI